MLLEIFFKVNSQQVTYDKEKRKFDSMKKRTLNKKFASRCIKVVANDIISKPNSALSRGRHHMKTLQLLMECLIHYGPSWRLEEISWWYWSKLLGIDILFEEIVFNAINVWYNISRSGYVYCDWRRLKSHQQCLKILKLFQWTSKKVIRIIFTAIITIFSKLN